MFQYSHYSAQKDLFKGVPIIHVFAHKTLASCKMNSEYKSLNSEEMIKAREMLMESLLSLLAGDELAAEFLLMHLMAKMYLSQHIKIILKANIARQASIRDIYP